MSDISSFIKGTGVALEAEALRQFGAAVEGKIGSILNKGGNTGTQMPNINGINNGVWEPTPYASAITSGAGGYDPKTKFLFKVRFEFSPAVAQMASSMGVDIADISRDLSFTIKQIDLPKVEFKYEEVNMYNFRTKILRNIEYRELSLTFYDDISNHSLNFVNIYMMLLMPITRRMYGPSSRFEDQGMTFDDVYIAPNTSYRSSLPENARNVITMLTIEQYYVERASDMVKSPLDIVKLNSFKFTNPRITTFDISDQDHSIGSEANQITMQVDFDALHIDTRVAAQDRQTVSMVGADILDEAETIAAEVIRGTPTQAGKARNPFVDIIASQAQRAAQSAVSNALGKAVSGVLGTSAGGALGGAIYQVSGAVGEAAAKTLRNVKLGTSQGAAKPSTPPIADNGAGTAQATNLASQSTPSDLGDFYG